MKPSLSPGIWHPTESGKLDTRIYYMDALKIFRFDTYMDYPDKINKLIRKSIEQYKQPVLKNDLRDVVSQMTIEELHAFDTAFSYALASSIRLKKSTVEYTKETYEAHLIAKICAYIIAERKSDRQFRNSRIRAKLLPVIIKFTGTVIYLTFCYYFIKYVLEQMSSAY